MSRNKQRKGNAYHHSAYSIEGGHGGMKRNMGAGASVKPQDKDDAGYSGKKAAEARAGKKPKEEEKRKTPESSIEPGDSGWDKIGKAGADMVTEYKQRQKDKADA